MKKNPLLNLAERAGDPEVAPGLRGVIVSLIIFKAITAQLLKQYGSGFFVWLDRVGWVGLGLGILALILLFINKYYINPPPKRTKKR